MVDGSQATVREESVGVLATRERIEERPADAAPSDQAPVPGRALLPQGAYRL